MRQDHERDRVFGRRALLVGAAELAAFGVVTGRLWQLQVEDSARFQLLAESNRISQRLAVPPRGRILDRGGRLVAGNVPIYRVRIVREQARDVRAVLGHLASLVPIDARRIDEIVAVAARQRAFVPVPVREDLTYDEVTRIAVNAPDLPGILLDDGLLRVYSQGNLLAHILGYTGPPTREDLERETDPLLHLPDVKIGKNGIERAYDRELRGRAGVLQVEVNAIGREIRDLQRQDGVPGRDLKLSLDIDLQRYCYERLDEVQAGSAVVVDVATGAVLAMASVPSYDPTVFTSALSPAVWRSLRDDPGHPLVNKCVRGQYPPGSTFKMMTALAALEAGAVTPTSAVFCPGAMQLGDAKFHCWRSGGHGSLSLVQALAQSCDVYFYELARRVGVDAIAAMARRFGIGHVLGVDLPGEQPGLMPTTAWKKQRYGISWQKGETLVCGIGQGYVLTTPLQLAIMTARLCNGGRAVEPWLVGGQTAHVSEGQGAPAAAMGLQPQHVRYVLQGMTEVVNGERGTARAAILRMADVQMAGKTGTAQVRRITKSERLSGAYKRKERPWKDRDHALFVAFAPVTAPRIAISVIVEHGESGAKTAGPLARDIMTKALQLERQIGRAGPPQLAAR